MRNSYLQDVTIFIANLLALCVSNQSEHTVNRNTRRKIIVFALVKTEGNEIAKELCGGGEEAALFYEVGKFCIAHRILTPFCFNKGREFEIIFYK